MNIGHYNGKVTKGEFYLRRSDLLGIFGIIQPRFLDCIINKYYVSKNDPRLLGFGFDENWKFLLKATATPRHGDSFDPHVGSVLVKEKLLRKATRLVKQIAKDINHEFDIIRYRVSETKGVAVCPEDYSKYASYHISDKTSVLKVVVPYYDGGSRISVCNVIRHYMDAGSAILGRISDDAKKSKAVELYSRSVQNLAEQLIPNSSWGTYDGWWKASVKIHLHKSDKHSEKSAKKELDIKFASHWGKICKCIRRGVLKAIDASRPNVNLRYWVGLAANLKKKRLALGIEFPQDN